MGKNQIIEIFLVWIYLKKIDIGSYPFFRLGKVGVSVVFRSSNEELIKKCKTEFLKIVKKNKIKFFVK